jgi:hypothetical protein
MKRACMKAAPKARARRGQKISHFSLEHLRRELSYRGRRWQPDGEAKKG